MTVESSTIQLERQRNIRLTAAQDDALEQIAADEGMTVSSLIRRTLVRSLFLPRDVRKSHGSGESVERNTSGGANDGALSVDDEGEFSNKAEATT